MLLTLARILSRRFIVKKLTANNVTNAISQITILAKKKETLYALAAEVRSPGETWREGKAGVREKNHPEASQQDRCSKATGTGETDRARPAPARATEDKIAMGVRAMEGHVRSGA